MEIVWKAKVGKIASGGVGAVGFAAAVGYFLTSNPPGLAVAVVCFLAGCVLTAPIAYWDELSRVVLPIRHLMELEQIQKTFKELVDDARHIVFDGPLDKTRADLFNAWIRKEAADQHRKPTIKIFNTDTRFYHDNATKQTLKTLVDLDKQYEFFECFHSFHHRPYSHLQITDKDDKKRSLVIFGDVKAPSHAVVIRDSAWVPVPIKDAGNVFPITFVEQTENYYRVDEQYWRFLEPLKHGWFHPVFPPIGNDHVRREWRAAILRWFNSTAVGLLRRAGTEGQVRITWLISEDSLTDAAAFAEWLALLKAHSEIPVQRVLMVNFPKFRNEPAYKEVVANIWQNYLPATPNPRYEIMVVDSSDLDPLDRRDFAILKVGNAEYAQNSATEPDGESPEEMLRIFFSQATTDVSVLARKFATLTANLSCYANFESFERAVNSGH